MRSTTARGWNALRGRGIRAPLRQVDSTLRWHLCPGRVIDRSPTHPMGVSREGSRRPVGTPEHPRSKAHDPSTFQDPPTAEQRAPNPRSRPDLRRPIEGTACNWLRIAGQRALEAREPRGRLEPSRAPHPGWMDAGASTSILHRQERPSFAGAPYTDGSKDMPRAHHTRSWRPIQPSARDAEAVAFTRLERSDRGCQRPS